MNELTVGWVEIPRSAEASGTSRAKQVLQALTNHSGIFDTNNPYEWVGEYHNDGLDYVFSTLISRYGSLNSSQKPLVPGLVEQFMHDRLGAQFSYDALNEIMQRSLAPSKFIVNGRINRSAAQKYYPFENSFYTYSDQILALGAAAGSFSNVVGLYNAAVAIEDKIIADTALSEVSKAVLLSTSSVFRNSLVYWYEDSTNNSHHKGGKHGNKKGSDSGVNTGNNNISSQNEGSSGNDSSGTDSSGTDSTGTDSTGTDSTGTDSTGTDTSGTNTSGTDTSGYSWSTDSSGTIGINSGFPDDPGSGGPIPKYVWADVTFGFGGAVAGAAGGFLSAGLSAVGTGVPASVWVYIYQ
jgi:hypothetical protein